MTVRRIMGIETEYGISHPDNPEATSEAMSREIISAYTRATRKLGHTDDVAWDLAGEMPMLDTRHPTISREHIASRNNIHQVASLTAQERSWQRGTTKVLHNGARFYVDHSHPEYASPECLGPRQTVMYDRAGELVMQRAMAQLQEVTGTSPAIYKNNVDGKGSSYGCHENYLVDRAVPFDDIVAALIPFLVTRPILVGAGRVGLGQASEEAGYQMSQRADYIESIIGPNTTYDRPIVNTRDEPHAEPHLHRRLHVISGDANCVPSNTLLKLGMTSLLLWVLETNGLPDEWKALELKDPVAAVKVVSRDLSLSQELELADGNRMTALDIQSTYQRTVDACLIEYHNGRSPDVETSDILYRWRDMIGLLADDWRQSVGDIEWATKLALLEARRSRDGLDWDAPELMAMDLQWSDVRKEKSLPDKLTERGILETMEADSWIEHAEFTPPAGTRAWFRGELIRRFPGQIYSASWHSIVVELDGGKLIRIPMTSPDAGSAMQLEDKLNACQSVEEVLDLVGGTGQNILADPDVYAKVGAR